MSAAKKHDYKIPVILRGPRLDILRLFTHLGERGRQIRNSSSSLPFEGAINQLVKTVHPDVQRMTVRNIERPEEGTAMYHLASSGSSGPAPFRAGSYITVEIQGDDGRIHGRPYSLCSTPAETAGAGEYILCVKNTDPGFVSLRILETWKVGTELLASAPEGLFCYEQLRDGGNLLFLAGGSGVTPFRSLASDILERCPDTKISLIQGARTRDGLLFREYFDKLAAGHEGRFRYVPVLSDETHPDYRQGFISSRLIDESLEEPGATAFICGPPGLHAHLDNELKKIPELVRRIRREDYGNPGAPTDKDGFTLTVRTGSGEHKVNADPGETVLVSMERAGINPPSSCRNGTCGFCRSRLIKGEAIYDREHRGLRQADRDFDYFHPCVTMPGSDMMIEIPSRSPSSGDVEY